MVEARDLSAGTWKKILRHELCETNRKRCVSDPTALGVVMGERRGVRYRCIAGCGRNRGAIRNSLIPGFSSSKTVSEVWATFQVICHVELQLTLVVFFGEGECGFVRGLGFRSGRTDSPHGLKSIY